MSNTFVLDVKWSYSAGGSIRLWQKIKQDLCYYYISSEFPVIYLIINNGFNRSRQCKFTMATDHLKFLKKCHSNAIKIKNNNQTDSR